MKHRRNVYGECPTSSRKNISRGKQRGHMEVRRAASEELRSLKGASTEVLDCSIMGLAAVSPRVTFSGSIVKDRIAFTQSFDYHFERTPVDGLPPLQSDTNPGDRVEGLGDFGMPTGELGTVRQVNEDDAIVKRDDDGRIRGHQPSLKVLAASHLVSWRGPFAVPEVSHSAQYLRSDSAKLRQVQEGNVARAAVLLGIQDRSMALFAIWRSEGSFARRLVL